VFSVHGAGAVPEIAKDQSGFTFIPHSESLNLDSAEYGSAFVSHEVVAEIARERCIAHLASVERDLWMLQDLYVVSRAPIRGFGAWRNVSFVQGVIDHVLIKDGEYAIDGWAADSRHDMPMRSVRLLIDGLEVASVDVDKRRVDVARIKGRPDWLNSGWSLHGQLPELSPGEHLLAAKGVSATGVTGVIDILPVTVSESACAPP